MDDELEMKRTADVLRLIEDSFAPYTTAEVKVFAETVTDEADLRSIARTVRAKDRQELSAGDLLDYYYLAVNRIGDSADLRHYLPRILELVLDDGTAGLLNPKHLPALLDVAGIRQWPPAERRAIAEFAKLGSDLSKIPRRVAEQLLELAPLERVEEPGDVARPLDD